MHVRSRSGETTKDLVALIIAIGLAVALNLLMFAVMYDAVRSDTPGLSENATQILTGWGGGIIGLLGGYLGYRAGRPGEDTPAPADGTTPLPKRAPDDSLPG